MSKTIVVTGGTGFIGSHIVDELLKEGDIVYCVDDLSGSTGEHRNKEAKYRLIDVASKDMLDFMQLCKPDEVWHLAANAREGGSWFQPRNVVRRNSYGLINVLEGAISGGNLKKFVLFSSMSVYGPQDPPFHEGMTPQPENIYAVSKYASEQYLRLLSDLYGFSWVIIRPHNVFGERVFRYDKIRNVIAIFANQVLRGEPIYIYGDGWHTRAHSYIEDCIGPMIKAGKLDNQVINIGGERYFSINETAELVKRALGVPNHEVIHLPGRYKEVAYAYCDHTKARNLLGFNELIGAENGIIRVCKEFEKQGPVNYRDIEPLTLKSDKIPKTWL